MTSMSTSFFLSVRSQSSFSWSSRRTYIDDSSYKKKLKEFLLYEKCNAEQTFHVIWIRTNFETYGYGWTTTGSPLEDSSCIKWKKDSRLYYRKKKRIRGSAPQTKGDF